MSINLTMLGQLVSFVFFVLFCMKFVWPPLTEIMRQRQKDIAEGLEKAAAAEQQLSEANNAAEQELEEAKKQAGELIAQANARASQIVEEAKGKANDESERILADAQSKIDQEINQAREALRGQVSVLAVEGAEKILEASVDKAAHQEMLNKLAASL